MSLLQLSGIRLAFGHRTILDDVTFALAPGSRVALAGANGSGKTTLMRVINGIIQPDAGRVVRRKSATVSYLPQSGVVLGPLSLAEEAERAFEPIRGAIDEAERLAERLAGVTEDSPETRTLLDELHRLQEQIQDSGYYHRAGVIDEVLTGLGFDRSEFQEAGQEFSGGWQMRIALARILLERPDILLLDEPTNYLDIEAREWLAAYLAGFRGAVLLVSHDRHFLDHTMNEVAELFRGRLSIYKGGYTAYEKKRSAEMGRLVEAYKRQQEEIAHHEEFIRRFRYNASKAAMVQSRVKMLDKIERIEIPESLKRMRFSFPPPPHSGRDVLRIAGLTKAYGDKVVIDALDLEVRSGEKIAIAGRNGAGKTTLLRILCGEDAYFSGQLTLGTGVKTAYFAQDREAAPDSKRSVIETVELVAPTDLYPRLRSLLGAFIFRGDDIHKPVSVLSGGEKSRLALVLMLLRPANLLILDEPTNHLDLYSKDVLLEALREFPGTVLFVSHDRYFLDKLATRVVELRAGEPAREFPGDYAYYLRRTAAEACDLERAGGEVEAPDRGAAVAPAASREEAKRQKSAMRRLERLEEELLARMEALEADHGRLTAELALPEVYLDGARIREVRVRLSANEAEQESVHDEWAAVAAELESLRGVAV